MSIIAEFTIPAEQFALSETLCVIPTLVVEVERVVAHGSARILPYFWMAGADPDEFESTARNDPSIEALTRIDALDEAVLYRATWVHGVECVVQTYTQPGAILLDATARNERWELRLRFDDEDDLTQFNVDTSENELAVELERLYRSSHPVSKSRPVLTEKQREVVLAGLRSGYYEIPRETQPSELAEEFGISQQALSNRFRRAHRALAENAFSVPPEDE